MDWRSLRRRVGLLEEKLGMRKAPFRIAFVMADYSALEEWAKRRDEDPDFDEPKPRTPLITDEQGRMLDGVRGEPLAPERQASAQLLIGVKPATEEDWADVEVYGHDGVTGEYGRLGLDGRL